MRRSRIARLGIASILLFFSGATALVYQILWVKQLSLVVGIDVHAVTTGVSGFFAGLALGGVIFGRGADRTPRPFGLYAALECGVAISGFGATVALAHAAPLFVRLEEAAGPLAWILPLVLVGVPAFLMGGTLPALVRASRPGEGSVGRSSGLLYAANTAGAIAGTLVAAFWLVPIMGIRGAAGAAALTNLALAGLSLIVARRQSLPVRETATAPPIAPPARLALAIYALAGGVALGYEVAWSQAIVPLLSTRVHAFAIVLATYLGGLVLGSALYARFADRVRRPWLIFGLLIAGAGVLALVSVALLGPWLVDAQGALGNAVLRATGNRSLAMCTRFATVAVVIVLGPTILLGAAFPAATRLVAGTARVGRDVGAVVALNTAGGIAGTLLTGFVLIPSLGVVRSFGVLATASGVLGAIAIARGGRWRRRPLALGASLPLVIGVTGLLLSREVPARLLGAAREGEIVFYEEGAGGTVAVLRQRAAAGPFRRLYIQGVSNSGDSMTSRRYMRLQALLPLVIHRAEPRSALVIGLGTGITAGALLAWPDLERRVCAELEPAVVRAASLFEGNLGAATDPRIDIRLRDGRHELLRAEQRYDLITLEPPPPSALGVVNLYSRDFYELARDRLEVEGILAQWWPLPTQNDEDSRSLVRSLLDVFPYVTLWTTELHEMLLVGSMSPLELDVARIRKRFAVPTVSAALAAVGVRSPEALLATYVTDRSGLERYAGDAPPITDDHPRIEHAAWVRRDELTRVLPRILEFRREPPLVGADPSLRAAIEAERETLLAFYQAALCGYAGEMEEWGELMKWVFQRDGQNPYYRWFVGR